MWKIITGNLVFAGLVWAWWMYVQGDRESMLAGSIFAFCSFLAGVLVGAWIAQPTRKLLPHRRRVSGVEAARVDAVFDQIQ